MQSPAPVASLPNPYIEKAKYPDGLGPEGDELLDPPCLSCARTQSSASTVPVQEALDFGSTLPVARLFCVRSGRTIRRLCRHSRSRSRRDRARCLDFFRLAMSPRARSGPVRRRLPISRGSLDCGPRPSPRRRSPVRSTSRRTTRPASGPPRRATLAGLPAHQAPPGP